MRNTYQIRKYLALAVSFALAAGMLAGCSRTDSSKQDPAAGTGNTGVNASGNVVAGAGSNTVQTAQTVQSETQAAASPQQETAASAGTAQNAQNVSGTTTQTQQSNNTSANQTAPASSGQAQAASSSSAGTQSQKQPAAGVTDDDSEGFNGTFEKSDGEEKVWITVESSDMIRFVFSTSMISGTAVVTGNTALYSGDDGYTVTFDVSEDILMVTVDGEDADQSGMNGIYYRDYGEDESGDDDSVFDGDETEEVDEYFDDDDLEDEME